MKTASMIRPESRKRQDLPKGGPPPALRIGISSCLLGNPVRYDGGHKLDRFLLETLGRYVEYVPVCPEVECGLPVPREAMRLVGDPVSPRLVTVRSGADHAERLRRWARHRVEELAADGLDGFIFKSGSPSCGVSRVKVHGRRGAPSRRGTGLFAAAFMRDLPMLPVGDETQLRDAVNRRRFVETAYALRRWRGMKKGAKTREGLTDYHARHRQLISSCSVSICRRMDSLLEESKGMRRDDLFAGYQILLGKAFGYRSTVDAERDF